MTKTTKLPVPPMKTRTSLHINTRQLWTHKLFMETTMTLIRLDGSQKASMTRKCLSHRLQNQLSPPRGKYIVHMQPQHNLSKPTVVPAKSDSDVMFC